MSSKLKRPRVEVEIEEESSFNVLVDLNDWDDPPVVAPKRGRGRPKISKSVEFEVMRPATPNTDEVRKHLKNVPPVAPQATSSGRNDSLNDHLLPDFNDNDPAAPNLQLQDKQRKKKSN
ncbi:hypothetical protein FRC11_004925, partial [Ceratobasidium sp. 423]